jgi:hypothetical protein
LDVIEIHLPMHACNVNVMIDSRNVDRFLVVQRNETTTLQAMNGIIMSTTLYMHCSSQDLRDQCSVIWQ